MKTPTHDLWLLPLLLISCRDKSKIDTDTYSPIEDTQADTGLDSNYSSCSGSFWIQVTTGTYLSCGLDDQGCVDCWGNQNLEEYDSTTAWDVWHPTGDDEPPDEVFTQICLPVALPEGGGWLGCGITADREVLCWGGDIGPAPAGEFVSVTCGASFACALDTDGMASCWGNESAYSNLPSGPFLQLSAGDYTTCGILTDGTIACAGPADYKEYLVPPDGAYVDVDVSQVTSACALKEDGTIACWGWGMAENVCDLSSKDLVTDLEISGQDCCGLTEDNQIACNRDNMPPSGTYTQLDMGHAHGCAVSLDGRIDCWGADEQGQATPPLLPE